MLSLHLNLQEIIQFFHLHPHAANFITFIVVFCEAMAVIGVIVPGTVAMTAIGMLVGSGVISAGQTFTFAILGAICGDYLSYIIGVYYQDRLHKIWPFKKHPALLERSEIFFAKHGGKSVFLGRFIGPMRAMVPMVAGMLKMPQGRFLLAAIPSVTIWAILYLIPGILLGALSLELPPKKATEFLLIILVLLILIWLITWATHLFARQIYRWFDRGVMRIWQFLQTHKTLRWFPKMLEDPREPDNHLQLSLIFIAIIFFTLFSVIFYSVTHHGILTIFNEPIYFFLTSLRTIPVDHLMIAITLFGDERIVLAAASLFLLWLIYKRYWYIAIHWFILILWSGGFLVMMKSMVFSPRPGGAWALSTSSSFPSGHTFLVVTFFGFWAVIIARELSKSSRWIPYAATAIITFCVAFSRIFLGAHWLTDILASILSGTAFVLLFTASYRRRHTVVFSVRQFAIVFISIYLLTWIAGGMVLLKKQVNTYVLRWPTQSISFNDLNKSNSIAAIPLYRSNRLGKPAEAFNITFVGNVDQLRQYLIKRGWVQQDAEFDLHGIAARLVGDQMLRHLPLLPSLYHNKPPVLLLTKDTAEKDTILILRLWQSDITIKNNGGRTFLLGEVNFSKEPPKLLHFPRKSVKGDKTKGKFLGATENLLEDLRGLHYQQITYPLTMQPREMQDLNWNGKVLLIW